MISTDADSLLQWVVSCGVVVVIDEMRFVL